MSLSFTPNLNLQNPALGDTGWNVPLVANTATLDSQNAIGALAVALHEVPSSTLNVKVSSGTFIAQDGSTVTYAGSSSFAITASSTFVIYLDGTSSWALTKAASYPSTPHVKLATVVAGSSTITSVTDNRQCAAVGGTIADGVNLAFGTTTGTKIGTATSQKLGFFNKTPIVQPTMGSATASGTYGATEQGMLQAVYNAVRNLGLGS
jgi:hypothetical protein